MWIFIILWWVFTAGHYGPKNKVIGDVLDWYKKCKKTAITESKLIATIQIKPDWDAIKEGRKFILSLSALPCIDK